MNLILKTLTELLSKVIEDINCGNSNISDEEALKLTDVIKSFTDKTERLSKYGAYTYLNISRATFDNLVKEGKLPKGIKLAGFKELFWIKKDLDNYIKMNRKNR